jgi:hypothetical protein
MPAGFQSWTNEDFAQITDADIFFTLSVKGTTDGVIWQQEGNNSAYCTVVFSGYSLSDAPMIAMKGPGSWATLQSSSELSLTFRIFSVSTSSPITYYLFTNRRPPTNASKSGLEVYNSDGQIVYASDTLIARPMGVFSGELFGSSSYSGQPINGRDIAHVPIKMGSYSFSNNIYGNLGSCSTPQGPGYSLTQTTGFQRSAIATATGNISSAPRFSQVTISNIFCSPTFSPNTSSSGGSLNYQSLIVDVTSF